jgi:LacI family transcriptional regulator
MVVPDVRLPTLKDVALKAGVHPGTASRALNPETASRVNAATAKRVLRAAKALGYQPNPIARSLRTNKTHTIGMLIPDLTNPLFPPMVRGVDQVLSTRGYTLLLADTDNNGAREEQLYSALRSRQVDGLVFGTALRQHPLLQRVIQAQVPVVLINRVSDDHAALAVVGDEANGVRQAVDHLLQLGHRQIAYIAGPQNTSTGAGRKQAFLSALRANDVDPDPRLVRECAAWTEQDGAQQLAALLDSGATATAVVAGNDMVALGCYDVLRARGIACPDEVSVVGFNDMPFVDKFAPPLTTVRLPNHEIGAEAARLLLDRIIGGPTVPRLVTLPVQLVVRGSTAPPRDARQLHRKRSPRTAAQGD